MKEGSPAEGGSTEESRKRERSEEREGSASASEAEAKEKEAEEKGQKDERETEKEGEKAEGKVEEPVKMEEDKVRTYERSAAAFVAMTHLHCFVLISENVDSSSFKKGIFSDRRRVRVQRGGRAIEVGVSGGGCGGNDAAQRDGDGAAASASHLLHLPAQSGSQHHETGSRSGECRPAG